MTKKEVEKIRSWCTHKDVEKALQALEQAQRKVERYEQVLIAIAKYHNWAGDGWESIRLRNLGESAREVLEG